MTQRHWQGGTREEFPPARAATLAGPPTPVGGSDLIVASAVLLTIPMFTDSALVIAQANRGSMLLLEYVVWFAAAFWIRTRLRRPALIDRLGSPMRKGMIALLVALAVSAILVWYSGLRSDTERMLPQVAALLFMSLPFFLFNAAARATDIDRPVVLTCHVILAICTISILGDVTAITDFEQRGGRYFGFLGDPVAWALTLPFLVYFSSNRLVIAAVAGLGIALTGSRAPAICVTAALLMLILFSRGRRIQYFVTLFLLLLLILYKSDIFETLASRFGATSLSSNDRVRTAILGLRIFENSPYFGSGYNSLTHFYPYRVTSSMQNTLSAQTSTFVQMLSDGGILLFLGYLSFVAASTTSGLALMKQSRAMAHSGVINGIVAWLLAMLWVNQSAAWFLVGSYVGPLVFGMAGIVSGYFARLRAARAPARQFSFPR